MAKLKKLRSLAQSLADMAASSRACPGLGPVASADETSFEIDLREIQVTRSGSMQPVLPLATELRAWLLAHLREVGLSIEELQRAVLTLEARTNRVSTDRSRVVLFELSSSCTLEAESRVYTACSGPNLVWYDQPAA